MPVINKKFGLVFIVLLTQLTLSIFGGVLLTSLPKDQKINQGVYIDNVSVGGLTKNQAVDKVTLHFQPLVEQQKLKLTFREKSWDISYGQLGAEYEYQAAVDQAYSLSREGNVIKRLYTVFKLKRKDVTVPVTIKMNQAKLQDQLNNVAKEVNNPPQNAAIAMEDSRIKIIPEKIGQEVDIKATLAEINKAVEMTQTPVVELKVNKKDPDITAQELTDIKDPLSVAVTLIDKDENDNRLDNIKLAAQILNGTVVKPDQVFSFNERTGARLKEKGYKEASVIDDGRVVPGVGGGVCQVSTTLYNSVLNAGLKVIERSPHSKPVPYVPVGLDATVADGKLDFKFQNNTRYPIGIIAEVQGNRLIIRTFGKQEKSNQTIKLTTEGLQTIEPNVVVKEDPDLNKGYSQIINRGEKGYRVKVYRIWYEGIKEIKKELISETQYDPADTLVRVGTKPVSNVTVNK